MYLSFTLASMNKKLNGHGDKDKVVSFNPRKANKPVHEPLINMPPLTKIGLGVIIFVHFTMFLLDKTGFSPLVEISYMEFGFIPARFAGDLSFTVLTLFTPITYAFLHGGWLHVAVNSLMLLALGAGFEKQMGSQKTAFVFFGSSILAAFLHFAFTPHSQALVIGASGGISGLFGGLLYLMFLNGQFGTRANFNKALLVFIGISVIFGLLGGPGGAPIAWIAHIGGFLGGVGLTYFIIRKRT